MTPVSGDYVQVRDHAVSLKSRACIFHNDWWEETFLARQWMCFNQCSTVVLQVTEE